MHKTAVGYAIGKLMQVLGGILLVPLGIALYDNRSLATGEILAIPEVLGFVCSILLSFVLGSAMAVIFRGGLELQGIKEGYAIVAIGWVLLTFWS